MTKKKKIRTYNSGCRDCPILEKLIDILDYLIRLQAVQPEDSGTAEDDEPHPNIMDLPCRPHQLIKAKRAGDEAPPDLNFHYERFYQ